MVFKSCQALLKHDINTALFLLPHVLLHVLLDGKAAGKNEVGFQQTFEFIGKQIKHFAFM